MCVCARARVCVCALQGLRRGVRERLAEFEFKTTTQLCICNNVDPDNDARAVHTALGQCDDLHASGPVYLNIWQWTDDMLQVVKDATPPPLPHRNFGIWLQDDLTSERLRGLLELRGIVSALHVDCKVGLDLETDENAQGVWPWELLQLAARWKIHQLASLPMPGPNHEGVLPVVRCERVDLNENIQDPVSLVSLA